MTEDMKSKNYHYYRPFLITLSICGFLFSIIYTFKYQAYTAALIMFSGTSMACTYWVLSREYFYTRATAYILLGVIFYTIGGSSFVTGAHNSTAVWWLTIAPLTAGIFLNLNAAFKSMLLSLSIVALQFITTTYFDFIPNEFAGKNTSTNSILSLTALITAISTLTLVYLKISHRINTQNKTLQDKITKERLQNAYQQGIFENSQNTLHAMGNTLTLLKSNMELFSKNDQLTKVKSVVETFKKQLELDKDISHKKFDSFVDFMDNSLSKIIHDNNSHLQDGHSKIDFILNTIDTMTNTEIKDCNEEVNLSHMIQEIIGDMNKILTKENIKVKKELDHKISLFLEPLRLEQALRNTVMHSIDSIKEKSKNHKNYNNREIIIKTLEIKDGYHFVIKDNGLDINNENKSEHFSLRNQATCDNTANSLHNTANYIKSVGGEIDITPIKPEGAALEIIFPKKQRPVA